jgi:hypothetical protein
MVRSLLRITPAHVASARALGEVPPFSLPADEADNLFVPAGHLPGSQTIELYWAAGVFTAEQAAALQQLAASLPWAQYDEYDLQTQPGFPQAKLAEMGLEPFTPELPL